MKNARKMIGPLKEQFTQTLITLDDVEALIQGLIPNKKLTIDFGLSEEQENHTLQLSKNSAVIQEFRTEGKEGNTPTDDSGRKSSQDTHFCDKDTDISLQHASFGEQNKNSSSCENQDKETGLFSKHDDLVVDFDNGVKQRRVCSKVSSVTRLQGKAGKACANDKLITSVARSDAYKQDCDNRLRGLIMVPNNADESKHGKQKCDSDLLTDKDAKLYKCCYCDKQFTSLKYLKSHCLIHEKKKEYSCEKCAKKFRRANELRLHLRTHTGEKPFSCETCGRAFTNSSALKRHHIVHNREGQDSLKADIAKHHGCPHCGKTFTVKGNLTVHMKIHTRTYNYVCPTCEKSFIVSGDLKRHLRVHSKEKPYTCTTCKKSFTTSSTLVCHMRSHTGERPYLCGVCGASFAILGHLKQHNRIHARGDLWPRKKGAKTVNETSRMNSGVSKQTVDSSNTVSIVKEELIKPSTQDTGQIGKTDGLHGTEVNKDTTPGTKRYTVDGHVSDVEPTTEYAIEYRDSGHTTQPVNCGSVQISSSTIELINPVSSIPPMNVTSDAHEMPGEIQIIISSAGSNEEFTNISRCSRSVSALNSLMTSSQINSQPTKFSVPITTCMSLQLPMPGTSISLPIVSSNFVEISDSALGMLVPDPSSYLQHVADQTVSPASHDSSFQNKISGQTRGTVGNCSINLTTEPHTVNSSSCISSVTQNDSNFSSTICSNQGMNSSSVIQPIVTKGSVPVVFSTIQLGTSTSSCGQDLHTSINRDHYSVSTIHSTNFGSVGQPERLQSSESSVTRLPPTGLSLPPSPSKPDKSS